jgi:hypothetical protein
MVEGDFRKIAEAIDIVLGGIEDEDRIRSARDIAVELCRTHPLPYQP